MKETQPYPDADGVLPAYVGLGSNMGDSRALLEKAVEGIDALLGVSVTALSSLYRTEPQGDTDQPFFLNQVAQLECRADMKPEDLLHALLELENSLGRVRDPARRHGPRSIDLDLLLYGNTRMGSEQLTLPHPRMLERAFVLAPLAEIAPALLLPCGLTVKEALDYISYSHQGDTLFQG